MFTITKIGIENPLSESQNKIIKSDLVIAHRTAENIISKASSEANQILKRAKDDYQTQINKAYKEGQTAWESERIKLINNFNQEIVDQIQSLKTNFSEQIIMLTEKIIGLSPDEKVLQGLINQAISQLSTDCALSLKVSPEDAPLARKVVTELTEDNTDINGFEVIVDSSIKESSYLLVHPEGTHDISVKTQLDQTNTLIKTID